MEQSGLVELRVICRGRCVRLRRRLGFAASLGCSLSAALVPTPDTGKSVRGFSRESPFGVPSARHAVLNCALHLDLARNICTSEA